MYYLLALDEEESDDANKENKETKEKFPGVLLRKTEVLPTAKHQCATYQFLFEKFPNFKIKNNFQGKFLIDRNGVPRLTDDPMKDIKALI